jgi:hypothetical protein
MPKRVPLQRLGSEKSPERLSIKHRHRLEITEKAIFKLSLDVTKQEIEVS